MNTTKITTNIYFSRAYTFIEIISVLTILSFLASMMMNHYTAIATRNRYRLATAGLYELATQMQEYYFLHHHFSGITLQGDELAPEFKQYYRFALEEVSEDHFLLSATPLHEQAHETDCGVFHLNEKQQEMTSVVDKQHLCWQKV